MFVAFASGLVFAVAVFCVVSEHHQRHVRQSSTVTERSTTRSFAFVFARVDSSLVPLASTAPSSSRASTSTHLALAVRHDRRVFIEIIVRVRLRVLAAIDAHVRHGDANGRARVRGHHRRGVAPTASRALFAHTPTASRELFAHTRARHRAHCSPTRPRHRAHSVCLVRDPVLDCSPTRAHGVVPIAPPDGRARASVRVRTAAVMTSRRRARARKKSKNHTHERLRARRRRGRRSDDVRGIVRRAVRGGSSVEDVAMEDDRIIKSAWTPEVGAATATRARTTTRALARRARGGGTLRR